MVGLVYVLSLFNISDAAAKICFLPDGSCGTSKMTGFDPKPNVSGCQYKSRTEAEKGIGECEEAYSLDNNPCWYRRCDADNTTIFNDYASCQKGLSQKKDKDKYECTSCGSCYKIAGKITPPDDTTCTTQADCDKDSKAFESNGTTNSNGVQCGICKPIERCSEGYSTIYQSQSDCLTGETFSSSGTANGKVCGKCTAASTPTPTPEPQSCSDVAATVNTTISTTDTFSLPFFVLDFDDAVKDFGTEYGQCPKNCILHDGSCFCAYNDPCSDDEINDPDYGYECDFCNYTDRLEGYEVTYKNFNFDNGNEDTNGDPYYTCSKTEKTYTCPSNDTNTYRLAGDTCKCSADVVPIFMKLCPDVAESGADAKLMIFVKDKSAKIHNILRNNLISTNDGTLAMLSGSQGGYNLKWTSYENEGRNQDKNNYSKYTQSYPLNSAFDYTSKPYSRGLSGFCQMSFCTIDTSNPESNDDYDLLTDSEKLRISEIDKGLTSENPFRPYIINASNTKSYEPTQSDGVSAFSSCGSDDCASVANMYIGQQGACSAHYEAADYIPLNIKDMKAYYDYNHMQVFYNPDTLENHKPDGKCPNGLLSCNDDEKILSSDNDCYAAIKVKEEAEKLYKKFSSDYNSKLSSCLTSYPEADTNQKYKICYNHYHDYSLCLQWYSGPYRGNQCCWGYDGIDTSTGNWVPGSLCGHEKEFDYTKYLYMQQLIEKSSGNEEAKYQSCLDAYNEAQKWW